MNAANKRKDTMDVDKNAKRVKKECSYGDKCYRRNPAHLREFSHPHLEAILDTSVGGDYTIPPELSLQRQLILEQLEIIVEKKLYEPRSSSTKTPDPPPAKQSNNAPQTIKTDQKPESSTSKETEIKLSRDVKDSKDDKNSFASNSDKKDTSIKGDGEKKAVDSGKTKDDYRPIVPPTRRATEYLTVVRPEGKMAAKHAASAPYHIFYTTIAAAKETHSQPTSITFLEILDRSLGELQCSLQINFMVEPAWLLAQYYFAGYSEKKLTILYGEECADLKNISTKKPHVEAYQVPMASPFAKHHTKMMILCYEDGSLRVVVSTANLYMDDWENRTQGLWFSPRCPELPPDAMPHDGDSPTQFKKSLLKYLAQYRTPMLSRYVARVQRCDFTHINVFLVASAPGGHFDMEFGMTRVGSLLRQHCSIPRSEQQRWPLLAQASSIGSYGKEPRLWLTGDFLHHFTKIKEQPQTLSQPPELKLIYPSLENVKQSHDGLLGGGCLPYAAEAHFKQPWLNSFLYQWKAKSSHRDKAMPHIKSYTRTSPDNKKSAYYLLTSGNVSKAAWGNINKGNAALRIMSYEAGVLFLPKFVINEDFFPLEPNAPNRLIIPYDIPPTKYTSDMQPWVMDYLH
ncbi:probable tyrosyl-DNA phosphodiesterase [Leguminivora glycinivorella]|uniref:probable tyrosyl-DNA phosphodiesterase n=1 Tax=Leguminivora glycinivorella TaxID=1035111 RepID=UPI0020103700|nr:probable tyrosyl-DNA phosphodiesterase [Leguminivora glycinivorella]